jgi:ribosomal protein L29
MSITCQLQSNVTKTLMRLLGFDFAYSAEQTEKNETHVKLYRRVIARMQTVLVIVAALIALFWSPFVIIKGLVVIAQNMGQVELFLIAIALDTTLASIHTAYAAYFLLRLTQSGKS